MHTLRYAVALGAALFAASPAHAQLRRSTTTYPDAQTVPAGMCRVWINGLPASRQPGPTDCETARRNAPANSRIIYGTQSRGAVYGNVDPRSIPGSPQYDPRYDPRSSQYDPRLARGSNGRYDSRYDRQTQKEREKWERKQRKEREKEWKKSHQGNGRDHDGDDDDDHHGNRNGQYGNQGSYGSRTTCADMNRDGVCDSAQSASRSIPRPIPQPVPQGTTRRVCVDANRDGKCDDGGPLVRMTP